MEKNDSFYSDGEKDLDANPAKNDESVISSTSEPPTKEQNLAVNVNFFNNKRNKTIYLIALTAMFTALNTIANAFLSFNITLTIKYSATLTFGFFTGLMIGPIYGFIAGFLGDFFGWLLFTDGIYNPIINFVSGLFCFIPGLVFYINKKYFNKEKNKHSFYIGMFVSFILCFVIGSVLLNSLGIWLYYPNLHVKHGTFWVYIGTRVVSQWPNAVINLILSLTLYSILKQVKYFKDII